MNELENQDLIKNFVTFDIAKALKKLGFNIPTMFGFDESGVLRIKIAYSIDGCKISWYKHDSHIYAPFWQDAVD